MEFKKKKKWRKENYTQTIETWCEIESFLHQTRRSEQGPVAGAARGRAAPRSTAAAPAEPTCPVCAPTAALCRESAENRPRALRQRGSKGKRQAGRSCEDEAETLRRGGAAGRSRDGQSRDGQSRARRRLTGLPAKGRRGRDGQPEPCKPPQRLQLSWRALEGCEETYTWGLCRGLGGRQLRRFWNSVALLGSWRRLSCPAGYSEHPSTRHQTPGRQNPISLTQGTQPALSLIAWKPGSVNGRSSLSNPVPAGRGVPKRVPTLIFPTLRSFQSECRQNRGSLSPVLDPPCAPGVGESRRQRGLDAEDSPRGAASQGMRRIASLVGPQSPVGSGEDRPSGGGGASRQQPLAPGVAPWTRQLVPLCRADGGRRAPSAGPAAELHRGPPVGSRRRLAQGPAAGSSPGPLPAVLSEPGSPLLEAVPVVSCPRLRLPHVHTAMHPAAAAVAPLQSPPGPGGVRPAATAAAELAGEVKEEASRAGGTVWRGGRRATGTRRAHGGTAAAEETGASEECEIWRREPQPVRRARRGQTRGSAAMTAVGRDLAFPSPAYASGEPTTFATTT